MYITVKKALGISAHYPDEHKHQRNLNQKQKVSFTDIIFCSPFFAAGLSLIQCNEQMCDKVDQVFTSVVILRISDVRLET